MLKNDFRKERKDLLVLFEIANMQQSISFNLTPNIKTKKKFVLLKNM